MKCPFYRIKSIEYIVNILELVDEMMCLGTPNKSLDVLFRNSVCVKVNAERNARESCVIVEDLNTKLNHS